MRSVCKRITVLLDILLSNLALVLLVSATKTSIRGLMTDFARLDRLGIEPLQKNDEGP